MNPIATIEAILFAHGHEITIEKLAEYANISTEECETVLKQYKDILQKDDRGLVLVQSSNKVQLTIKQQFQQLLAEKVTTESKEPLSQSAMDTLAIIAYCGGATRAEIEEIRGVKSSFMLRKLSMKGLIQKTFLPEDKRNPVYVPTVELLQHLGVKSIHELPEQKDIKAFVKDLRTQLRKTVYSE